MIHVSSFERLGKLIEYYEEGDLIIAKIKSYQEDKGRYLLNFVRDFDKGGYTLEAWA
jgi:exosome complex RNA-binding protein Rrp4